MKKILRNRFASRWLRPALVTCSWSLIFASAAFAQAAGGSPWENAVNVLMQAFTTTIARGLSLVSIVVAGLTFAFGEGSSKRILAGVLFGVGMAIAAVKFFSLSRQPKCIPIEATQSISSLKSVLPGETWRTLCTVIRDAADDFLWVVASPEGTLRVGPIALGLGECFWRTA
jgi:type IV secretion system protein TrbC